jgi:uncharacterized GH25 family protein
MNRILMAASAALAMIATAQAHFVYVVPTDDGKNVQLVFSDSLAPDKSVPITKVAGTKLTLRSKGKDTVLETKQVENYLAAATPGDGTRVVFGHTDYGVVQKGEAPAFHLHYFPKTILGDAFAADASVGKATPFEIIPVRDGGKVKFQVMAEGKPLADAEVFLRKPGTEKNEILKTDANGYTPASVETGRYAVVARNTEMKSGELNGKKFAEVRYYATLVADILPVK